MNGRMKEKLMRRIGEGQIIELPVPSKENLLRGPGRKTRGATEDGVEERRKCDGGNHGQEGPKEGQGLACRSQPG